MMMADARADDDDIFVYMGGDQQVPSRVRRARIHKSVKIVRAGAFQNRWRLISVEFHDGIEIIEEDVFYGCHSLRSIKLLGIRIIKGRAFWCCQNLTDVEFGDKLETIEKDALHFCTALENIKMPSVRTVGKWAFGECSELSDVEFGEELRTLEERAFCCCPKLRRIALPLKDGIIGDLVFTQCPMLTTVDLVGGIHQTVASLHMESWRIKMNKEINRINQVLPTTAAWQKTGKIRQWMESVIRRLDRYKAEHKAILKEATTLLELALWKDKLGDNEKDEKVAMDTLRARAESRVTSGADVVIKNVLPFLKLE